MDAISKYTCAYPFGHRYVVKSKNGYDFKPCCFSNPTHQYFENIDSITISENLKKLQEQFLKGELPDICSVCKEAEQNNQKSWRQRSFNEIDPSDGISSWDIRLDNICNLKCVMCNADNSSKWREEEDILKKYEIGKDYDNRKLADIDWLLKKTLGKAKYITLLGGEPFYSKNNLIFCNTLSQNIWNQNNTTISFVTNGTGISLKWIDVLSRFKKVVITISIDGTDDVNNLIRYPTNWNTFLDTIDIIKKQKTWLYNFNTTVSALNLPIITNIKKYANPLWYTNILQDPSFLHINSLKPDIVKQNTGIIHIDKYIERNYKYNDEGNKKMKNYLQDLDNSRGTDSKRILPWCWK